MCDVRSLHTTWTVLSYPDWRKGRKAFLIMTVQYSREEEEEEKKKKQTKQPLSKGLRRTLGKVISRISTVKLDSMWNQHIRYILFSLIPVRLWLEPSLKCFLFFFFSKWWTCCRDFLTHPALWQCCAGGCVSTLGTRWRSSGATEIVLRLLEWFHSFNLDVHMPLHSLIYVYLFFRSHWRRSANTADQ